MASPTIEAARDRIRGIWRDVTTPDQRERAHADTAAELRRAVKVTRADLEPPVVPCYWDLSHADKLRELGRQARRLRHSGDPRSAIGNSLANAAEGPPVVRCYWSLSAVEKLRELDRQIRRLEPTQTDSGEWVHLGLDALDREEIEQDGEGRHSLGAGAPGVVRAAVAAGSLTVDVPMSVRSREVAGHFGFTL